MLASEYSYCKVGFQNLQRNKGWLPFIVRNSLVPKSIVLKEIIYKS